MTDRITINTQIRNGIPCIRNMRISVNDILSYLISGMTIEEILSDFPYLEYDDIVACFHFCVEEIKKNYK
jgi:uncharacterized protein (DUF433 family)